MRNRLLAIIMIFALCFTVCSCGGSDEPKELVWDNDGESLIAEYDFDMEMSGEGTMMGVLDKLDYSKLSKEKKTLQTKTEECIEKADLGNYDLYADFEKMEESQEEAIEYGYDMGDILYVAGTEDEDMELGVLEVAAYQNPMESKYYQYAIYNTKTYYGAEGTDCDEIAELLQDTFGITLDPEKLEEAAKILEEKALNAEIEEEEEDTEDAEEEDLEEADLEEDAEEVEPEEGDEENVLESDEEGEGNKVGDDGEEDVIEIDGDGGDIDLDDLDFDFLDEGGAGFYPCYMKQEAEFQGEGFKDTATFYLIGENLGDGSIAIYGAIERYRCYDEQ